MRLSDTTKLCIYSTDKRTSVFDSEFNKIKTYDYDDLYYNQVNYKEYSFLSKDEETIIIDEKSNIVAKLSIPNFKFQLFGTTLYYIKGKKVGIIDLSNIIGK